MCFTRLLIVTEEIEKVFQTWDDNNPEKIVQSLKKNLPFRNILRNIFKNKLPYDVFADKWPEFGMLMAKPRSERDLVFPAYNVSIHSDNPQETLDLKLLSQSDLLPNSDHVIYIVGMNDVTLGMLKKYCDMKRARIETPLVAKVFKVPLNEALRKEISEYFRNQYECCDLDASEHAPVIVKETDHKDRVLMGDLNETDYVNFIKYYIKTGVALGIFTRTERELVSWCVTNIDCSILNSNTIPRERNQGLYKWCLLETAVRVNESGCTLLHYIADFEPHEKKVLAQLNGGKAIESLPPDQNVAPSYILPAPADFLESDEESDNENE